MTRGRHHNLACVITEPAGDEHQHANRRPRRRPRRSPTKDQQPEIRHRNPPRRTRPPSRRPSRPGRHRRGPPPSPGPHRTSSVRSLAKKPDGKRSPTPMTRQRPMTPSTKAPSCEAADTYLLRPRLVPTARARPAPEPSMCSRDDPNRQGSECSFGASLNQALIPVTRPVVFAARYEALRISGNRRSGDPAIRRSGDAGRRVVGEFSRRVGAVSAAGNNPRSATQERRMAQCVGGPEQAHLVGVGARTSPEWPWLPSRFGPHRQPPRVGRDGR